MTEREVLTIARERIAKGWTQGTYAIDANGRKTIASADDAACWCLLGAIQGPSGFPKREVVFHLTNLASTVAGLPTTIAEWNDQPGRTRAEVLALIDQALAALP